MVGVGSSFFQEFVPMNPARWLIAISLMFLSVLPADGQAKRMEEPLYPIKQGHRWYYRVTDVKAAKSAETPAKPQQVIITAESEQTFKLKKKTDQLQDYTEEIIGYNLQVFGGAKILYEQVLVADDGVYRVSGAGKLIEPPLRFLKAKARKGDTWKCDSQSENAVLKGEFSADEEVVKVPAGVYKTVVVRSRDFQVGGQKMQVEYWFSPNVGMVKQRVQVGNHHVVLELEKIEGK
jgi:hypothetical protein